MSLFNAKLKKGAASACLLLAASAQAQLLELSDVPLFLNASLEPNILVNFDDSGSMEWAWMPDNHFGLRTTRRGKSIRMNRVFYDPFVNYEVPIRYDGTKYPEHPFTDSCDRGMQNECTAADDGDGRDLSTNYRTDWYYDGTGQEWADNAQPAYYYSYYLDHPQGPQPVPNNCTAGNQNDDDCYIYVAVTATSGPGNTDERQNYSNWYSYYRRRVQLAKSAALRAFGTMGDDLRIAWQRINDWGYSGLGQMNLMEGTHRQNFFSFLANVNATGGTPLLWAMRRTQNLFRSTAAGNPFQVDFEISPGNVVQREFSCRQSYQVMITDGYWNSGAPSGINNADNSGSVLPDGKVYAPGAGEGRIYSDGNSSYLADMAFQSWSQDLRTDLDDNVPATLDERWGVSGVPVTVPDGVDPWTFPEMYWNPKNDPAQWQHLVNFMIGMGVNGPRVFPTDFAGLRDGTLSWTNDHIDDLWHAAVNSRGQYFSAGDPQALVDAFSELLQTIIKRKASASAVSVSTGVVTTGATAFRTGFDSGGWTGQLIAFPVNDDGTFGSAVWDAGCVITGGPCDALGGVSAGLGQNFNDRNILSMNDSGNPIAFRWGSLSTNQQNLLNQDPVTGNTDGLGPERLDYLRGDRTNEVANGGPFRTRTGLLGDVINSRAIYVAAPAESYRDAWPSGSPEIASPYADYKEAQLNRPGVVYIGANDGMMHAIDAATGSEKWAYVPNKMYKKLGQLSNVGYGHESFVDNTVHVGDAFVGGAWKTLLVGGYRLGGQGLYALDITDYAGTEGNPGAKVLWEFTDESAGGANLGYSYGQPQITRLLYNNKWVAVVGNGYNNSEADAAVGNGHATLYILDLQTGAVIKELDTGAGSAARPNGLATPQLADYNGDGVTDAIFAGDLMGNMWRFDVSDPSSPGSWVVEKIFEPATDWVQP
ncbi:MAG: pilus assembly protein, partial [bacterium]